MNPMENYAEVGENRFTLPARLRACTRTYGLGDRVRRQFEELSLQEDSEPTGPIVSPSASSMMEGRVTLNQFEEEEENPTTNDTTSGGGGGGQVQAINPHTTEPDCEVGGNEAQSGPSSYQPSSSVGEREGTFRGTRPTDFVNRGAASSELTGPVKRAQTVVGRGNLSQFEKEMIPETLGIGRGRGRARPIKPNTAAAPKWPQEVNANLNQCEETGVPTTTNDRESGRSHAPQMKSDTTLPKREVGGDKVQSLETSASSSKTTDPGPSTDTSSTHTKTIFLKPEMMAPSKPDSWVLTYQQRHEFFMGGAAALNEAPVQMMEQKRVLPQGEGIIVHSRLVPREPREKKAKKSGGTSSGYIVFLLYKARKAGLTGSVFDFMCIFDKNWQALSEEEKQDWKECAKNGRKFPYGKSKRSDAGSTSHEGLPSSSPKGAATSSGLDEIEEESDDGYGYL